MRETQRRPDPLGVASRRGSSDNRAAVVIALRRAIEAEQVTLEAFAPIFLEYMRTRGVKTIGEMQRRIYKWFCYDPELSPHICSTCGRGSRDHRSQPRS
jgi:hypothetical protein